MRMDLLTRAPAEFDLLTVNHITYSIIFLPRPVRRRPNRVLRLPAGMIARSIFGCEQQKF